MLTDKSKLRGGALQALRVVMIQDCAEGGMAVDADKLTFPRQQGDSANTLVM